LIDHDADLAVGREIDEGLVLVVADQQVAVAPQHGPGRKHTRPIELEQWQRQIVERHPGAFLRGLFHSDGCRVTNRIVVRGRTYEYPRYMFTNKSTDIMGLCQWALDILGIPWRMARSDNLSVARREAVAALDVWVGPKA